MTTTQILIAVVLVIIAALLKSVTGIGYPLVLIPGLALFVDISEAIVLIAPSNFLLNAQMSWGARSELPNARTLRPFLGGAVIGSAIGTLLLPILPERVLRLLLIAIIVLFGVNRLRRNRRTEPEATAQRNDRLAPLVGWIAGVFQGAAGISGPLVTPWFLSRRISVEAFVFAVTLTFAITGAVQLVVIVVGGQFGSQLLLGLALIPIALAVIPVGTAIRHRMQTAVFENLVLLILALAAVSLILRML